MDYGIPIDETTHKGGIDEMNNWNHPERIREPIKVGDIVMVCMNDYYPMRAKIIREPVEGDELWYIQVTGNIDPDGIKLEGVIQAINSRSSQFVRFVKQTEDELSE